MKKVSEQEGNKKIWKSTDLNVSPGYVINHSEVNRRKAPR